MANNNLQPDYANHYYRVRKGFTVYALVGHTKSNTYYGASMLYGNCYRKIALKRGDQIHALVGGIFLARMDGSTFQVSLALSEKHPFEKTYFTPEDKWPVEQLDEIPYESRRVVNYRTELPIMDAGSSIGRGINVLV